MPTNTFFNQDNCDRCKTTLTNKARIMSWFTKETICMDCKEKENEIKELLKHAGVNPNTLEGCGYIPTPRAIPPSRVLFQ